LKITQSLSVLSSLLHSYIQSHKPLSHDSGGIDNDELEAVIEKFFRNLFPLAYHHAVHSQNAAALTHDTGEEQDVATNGDTAARDFHIDYKNCLINSYESLQPFGDIPYSISRSLVQSVSSASTLLRALQRGADVLTEIESLPIESSLSTKCQHALLKMNYCPACKGHNYHHLKPCFGFCSNVMR
jgi:dally-like protein